MHNTPILGHLGFYTSSKADELDLKYIERIVQHEYNCDNEALQYLRDRLLTTLMNTLYLYFADNIDILLARPVMRVFLEKEMLRNDMVSISYPKWKDTFPSKKERFYIMDEYGSYIHDIFQEKRAKIIDIPNSILTVMYINLQKARTCKDMVNQWNIQNKDLIAQGLKGFINKHSEWLKKYIECIDNANMMHFRSMHKNEESHHISILQNQLCPYELVKALQQQGAMLDWFDQDILQHALHMEMLSPQKCSEIRIDWFNCIYPEKMNALHKQSRKSITQLLSVNTLEDLQTYIDLNHDTYLAMLNLTIPTEFFNLFNIQNNLDIFVFLGQQKSYLGLEEIPW